MSTLDVVLFFVSVISVIAFGIWKGRAEAAAASARGYFLAGRGLTWWLVGFSLIAANISTEQFVGMSGQAADWLGLAIASYEWMAAITLVVVAFLFLPKLLRTGIYTIPEFLEHRYGVFSRTIMAVATMIILVGVPTASVVFSGAKVITVFFHDTSVFGLDLGNLTVACWIIGISAAVYVFVGGLKACAWTDLIWGAALIVGGAVVLALALQAIGAKSPDELIATKVATSTVTVEQLADASALERFQMLNSGPAVAGPNGSGGKLHMVRPQSDPAIPWTALLVGLWIPNFFYWGLNQYIVQRTLGSKSLAEGQKGIIFAALLKLIIPFVVVIPGMLAFNLYNGDLRKQGELKNAAVIAEFNAGSARVFPFTENFAKLNPELALTIAQSNAQKVGADLSADAGDSVALANANAATVAAAQAKGLKSATQLVGYDYDAAFGTLLRNLLKPGITWFVLAAIFGAVVSSLASMLNSASTIFTMDIFAKLSKNSSEGTLVRVGKFSTLVFVGISCIIAPQLGRPEFGGIFTFIQEFQGFISPGVLTVFLFGFLVPRAPRYVGWLGIVINAALYGTLKFAAPGIAFLDRMAICMAVVAAVLGLLTLLNPLKQPVVLPVNNEIALETSKSAKVWGWIIVVATLALYVIFW
ncbi:MAG: sodium/solute symporter [Opitutus sp.]|nr:sodium/solute symporter [Opitutus sp.]